jgi:hypothetical protein
VNPEEVRARLRAAYFSEAPHERALLAGLPGLLGRLVQRAAGR